MKNYIEGHGEVAGYQFVKVKEQDNVYIYKQMDGDRFVSFEVFRARKRNGKFVYPRSSDWGIRAWTIKDENRALSKFDELVSSLG